MNESEINALAISVRDNLSDAEIAKAFEELGLRFEKNKSDGSFYTTLPGGRTLTVRGHGGRRASSGDLIPFDSLSLPHNQRHAMGELIHNCICRIHGEVNPSWDETIDKFQKNSVYKKVETMINSHPPQA